MSTTLVLDSTPTLVSASASAPQVVFNIGPGSVSYSHGLIPKGATAQFSLDTNLTSPQGASVIVSEPGERSSSQFLTTGVVGGVLAGNLPNPSFAVDMATQAELDAAGGGQELADHEAATLDVHGIDDTSALATQADLAALTFGSGVGYANHGSTAATARPTGFTAVVWVGSVEPSNAADGDLWVDTTT